MAGLNRKIDLQLLLSHEGEADEGQKLLNFIKALVRLLRPAHASCEKAALRACLHHQASEKQTVTPITHPEDKSLHRQACCCSRNLDKQHAVPARLIHMLIAASHAIQ